jgi:hypothetical protein
MNLKNLIQGNNLKFILVGIILILIFFNLKSCQSKADIEQVYKQNMAAMNDSVTYYKGSYKKTSYQLSKAEAIIHDPNFKTIFQEVEKIKKVKEVIYLQAEYNNEVFIESGIQKVNDTLYTISFSDSNMVRTIDGETYVKLITKEEKIGEDSIVTTFQLGLFNKENKGNTKLTDKFNFALALSLVEEKGIQKVIATPFTTKMENGKMVLGDKIPQDILNIPVLESVILEKPKDVRKNGVALNLGLGATLGYDVTTQNAGIVIGPTISIGYSIRSIKELFK